MPGCCFLGAEGEEKLPLGVPLGKVGGEGVSLHVWQSTMVVDFPPCLLILLLDPLRDGGVAGRQDGGIVLSGKKGGELLTERGEGWGRGGTEGRGGV